MGQKLPEFFFRLSGDQKAESPERIIVYYFSGVNSSY